MGEDVAARMIARLVAALPPGRALVVGVTGHRWNRIPRAFGPALDAAFAGLFARIAARVADVELVTGMAEGADLAAVAGLPPAGRLRMLLARPADDWARHLARRDPSGEASARFAAARLRPGVVAEIVPPAPGGAPDYVALGRRLVESVDLLVAVHDGGGTRPGGTGEVMAAARARGLPVLVLPVREDGIGAPVSLPGADGSPV